MKKYLLLLLLPFIFLNDVKADDYQIINIQYGGSDKSEYYYLYNLNWSSWSVYSSDTSNSCSSRVDCYFQALSYFNNSGYQYYSMFINILPVSNQIELYIIPFNFSSDTITQYVSTTGGSNISRFHSYKNDNTSDILYVVLDGFSDPSYNNFYMFYDSNYNFVSLDDSSYLFKGFYDNEDNENYDSYLKISKNDPIPKIKDLLDFSSWSDYENNYLENYTEVNLDDYEYVLLSLKDYNQKEAFSSNLQVKGQIGITPIYNYGQTAKDDVINHQITDRCNVNYSDYTDYRLYVTDTDLSNNSIYAVKSCNSGSSFKFDNSVFNIIYVTSENKDDPTITINGKTYHTIPYSNLPSTATQNEEENYIPGESEDSITGNTVGLSGIVKNVQSKLSEIWNIFTYFMSFVNQIFSVLPDEIRTVLVASFSIGCILGLIKIFIN